MKKLARNALLWCGYDESPRMRIACIKAPKTGLLSTPLNAINYECTIILHWPRRSHLHGLGPGSKNVIE